MKNKALNIFILIFLLIFAYNLLSHRELVLETVNSSIDIWIKNIFPSLFPFFVISDLLINYGFASFLGELLKPVMYKLFKVKGESSIVFILSMLSGFPGNAKITRNLYDQGLIDEKEATKFLAFTHFSNPLFVLGTVAIIFLSNKKVGMIILLAHYLSNIFVGLCFRNYHKTCYDNLKISLKKACSSFNNKKSFGKILLKSIGNAIDTMLLILGIITSFLVITSVIIEHLNVSLLSEAIIKGFFEITQGLKILGMTNISSLNKVLIATGILSFGGLSVHMQVYSQINDTKIKYLPFCIGRILQCIFSVIIAYLLYFLLA